MWGQGRYTHVDASLRFVAGVTLAFFLFRALIPTGFMPNVEALGEGRLELVICTSSGEHVVQVIDLGSPDNDAPNKKSADSDCPYSLALAKAFTVPGTVAIAWEFLARAPHGMAPAARFLLPPSLGPPLGSRAPPQHLV